MSPVEVYIQKLRSVFKNNDYRSAHEKSKEILLAMARDKEVLFDIIRRNLSTPGFFSKKRINPVVAFELVQTKHFSITAHCWLPLPDRATNITHQSIHHHGRLLLTSVAPFGRGYESIVFKKNFRIDKQAGIANMQIEKIYRNPQFNIEFVDSFTPHVVFYPEEFSITYAMWSYDKKDGIVSSIRHSKIVQSNKLAIFKVLRRLGLLKKAGVNVLEYFDFYPHNKKIFALKDRVMYPEGTNKNFIWNVFYILQQVGFRDKDFLKHLNSQLTQDERINVKEPLQFFLEDKEIKDVFEPVHLNISKINFTKEDLLCCFN